MLFILLKLTIINKANIGKRKLPLKFRRSKKLFTFSARSLYFKQKDMKLTDTQTAQLAGAIADMFENGADYICYETAEIANTVEGEPVLVRRTFQIGIREIFRGKEV